MFTENNKIICTDNIIKINELKEYLKNNKGVYTRNNTCVNYCVENCVEIKEDIYIDEIYHIKNKYIDVYVTGDHKFDLINQNGDNVSISAKDLYNNLISYYNHRYFIPKLKKQKIIYPDNGLTDVLLNFIFDDEELKNSSNYNLIIVPKTITYTECIDKLSKNDIESYVVFSESLGMIVKCSDFVNKTNKTTAHSFLYEFDKNQVDIYIETRKFIEPLFVPENEFILYLRNCMMDLFNIKVPIVEDEDSFLLNKNTVKFMWRELVSNLTDNFTKFDNRITDILNTPDKIVNFLYDIYNVNYNIEFTVNEDNFYNFIKLIIKLGYNFSLDIIPGPRTNYYKIKYYNKDIEITKNDIKIFDIIDEFDFDNNVYDIKTKIVGNKFLVSSSNNFVFI